MKEEWEICKVLYGLYKGSGGSGGVIQGLWGVYKSFGGDLQGFCRVLEDSTGASEAGFVRLQ